MIKVPKINQMNSTKNAHNRKRIDDSNNNPWMIFIVKVLFIIIIILSLPKLVEGKSNNRRRRQRRRRNIELKTNQENCVAHCTQQQDDEKLHISVVLEESLNCIDRCVSPDCYNEIFAENPLEDGEVDRNRHNSFENCVRNEIKIQQQEERRKK
mmetsp:Transcript_34279/g.39025  ORF Transcript_34279/g.39025 Transcript_34279/m.39025 type:complete len:154 (-) Transcript_34279:46-507(-)